MIFKKYFTYSKKSESKSSKMANHCVTRIRMILILGAFLFALHRIKQEALLRPNLVSSWDSILFTEDLLVSRRCSFGAIGALFPTKLHLQQSTSTGAHDRRRPTLCGSCMRVLLLLALSGDIELNPGPNMTAGTSSLQTPTKIGNNPGSTERSANQSPSLFYMNARSIADHKLIQFNTYFADNGDYDIICLSETWLHSGVFDGEILDDSQYCVYRRDRLQVNGRDKRGGGVLAAVSTRFKSRGREDLESAKCETVWCEIELGSNSRLIIGCCYLPPKPTISSLEDFHDMLTKV